VTSQTQRWIPQICRYSSHAEEQRKSWMCVMKRFKGSGEPEALAGVRDSLLPHLQGYSPSALYCSAVCSCLLLPRGCINHSSPNLCSCTIAKVISTVHILRELFLSPEQPASALACAGLSARLKMLYQSSLVLFKESAEEGKKLMQSCQPSYMEPPESPSEEGWSNGSKCLWRSHFPPAWASLPLAILALAVLMLPTPVYPNSSVKHPKS